MNRTLTSRTALATALATGLLFAAGGAVASDQENTASVQNDVQDTSAEQIDQDSNLTNTEQLDRADSDQPVDDTWITTKVKSSLLADTDTAVTNNQGETKKVVVALSGNVGSQVEADAATRIASEIEGVVDVDSSDLNFGTMGSYEGEEDDEQ